MESDLNNVNILWKNCRGSGLCINYLYFGRQVPILAENYLEYLTCNISSAMMVKSQTKEQFKNISAIRDYVPTSWWAQ